MRIGQKLWIFYYWPIFESVRIFLFRLYLYISDPMSYLNGDNQVVYANNFFSGQASECQNAATHTGNLFSKAKNH